MFYLAWDAGFQRPSVFWKCAYSQKNRLIKVIPKELQYHSQRKHRIQDSGNIGLKIVFFTGTIRYRKEKIWLILIKLHQQN